MADSDSNAPATKEERLKTDMTSLRERLTATLRDMQPILKAFYAVAETQQKRLNMPPAA